MSKKTLQDILLSSQNEVNDAEFEGADEVDDFGKHYDLDLWYDQHGLGKGHDFYEHPSGYNVHMDEFTKFDEKEARVNPQFGYLVHVTPEQPFPIPHAHYAHLRHHYDADHDLRQAIERRYTAE